MSISFIETPAEAKALTLRLINDLNREIEIRDRRIQELSARLSQLEGAAQ